MTRFSFTQFSSYLLFYLTVVYFYALYSYGLDYLLLSLESAQHAIYRSSPISYIIAFVVAYGFLSLPISIAYNAAVKYYFQIPNYKTIAFGLLIGLTIGILMKRNGLSYYIGEYRHLKNILLYALIGVSVETMRLIVYKLRNRESARTSSI